MTEKRCEKCFQPMDYAVRIMSAVGMREICNSCAEKKVAARETPTHLFKDFRPKSYNKV